MQTIAKWSQEATAHRKWIIRHALRKQLKQDDSAAHKIIAALG
jgi:3-methyladenine DNA glycosylase AlkC